jgi:hypothetical protein
MKALLHSALVLLVLIGFGNCNTGTPVASEISQLHGSWKWLQSVGGFAGETRTPESTGHTVSIVFGVDGKAQFYQDGIAQIRYPYIVTNEKPYPDAKDIYFVEFLGAPAPSNKQMISYKGVDTLLLADLCIDCYQHTYARIKP